MGVPILHDRSHLDMILEAHGSKSENVSSFTFGGQLKV
jgi:hypothetical protein